MRPQSLPQLAAILFLALGMQLAAKAKDKADSPDAPDYKGKLGSDFLDMMANAPLPFTGEDSELSIDIRPKFGDMIHEPYIRLPIELNYGFTRKREGHIGFIPFFNNPFDSEPESSLGYFVFGLKQRINNLANERMDLAVGFDARMPFEEIPSDLLRDNFDIYKPFVTAAYRLDNERQWLAFSSFEYHFVGDDNRNAETANTEPPSLAVFRPGIIYQPAGEYRYSIQLEYKTDRIDSGEDDGFKIIPGITWFPPPDTPVFRSIAGHFELALNLEYALSEIEEEEPGSDLGVSLNVRWRLYPKKPAPEDSVF